MNRDFQGRSAEKVEGNNKVMGIALLCLLITLGVMLIDKYLL